MNPWRCLFLLALIALAAGCAAPLPAQPTRSPAPAPSAPPAAPEAAPSPAPSATASPAPTAAPTPTPLPSATPRPERTLYNMYIGKDTLRQPDLVRTPPAPIVKMREVDGFAKSYAHIMFNGLQVNGEEIKGERQMLTMLVKLLNEALAKEFVSQTVLSAYRSYEDQVYLNQKEKTESERFLAPPGRSEHHLGTAVDLAWGTERLDFYLMNADRRAQQYYDWLKLNAHRFGFVFSYPYKTSADRSQTNLLEPFITEYRAEPWHLRYVGVDLATQIYTAKDEQGRSYLDPLSSLIPQAFMEPPAGN